MYREAYVQRYGVAHLAMPLVFLAMTLVLVALLIAGWRLATGGGQRRRRRRRVPGGFREGEHRNGGANPVR